MAIRLRKTDQGTLALDASKASERPGDVYLDDEQHHALTMMYSRMWGTFEVGVLHRKLIAEHEDLNPPDFR